MTHTEWGVEDPWGNHPVNDRAAAERMAANLRHAGHDARVVWRAVSDWQEVEDE